MTPDLFSLGRRDGTGRERLTVSRRDFMSACMAAAAAVGLTGTAAAQVVDAAARGLKPSVIWLHFQECTGCTMTLLRPTHPALDELILDLISLDYHETLFAAAGHNAEEAMHKAMEANAGKYIAVIEGAIPMKDGGVYCMVGGRTALDITRDVASKAAAVVAIGSCASWGGIPSSDPNPTGAVGVHEIVKDKPVVNLPGCPANPYILLGTVLQYVTLGKLPELDEQGRPKFAYGRTIHEHCPRRPHFDAGRFAGMYGDENHRAGYCLYKLGCKGPQTHANCSLLPFCEVPGAWPIGIGHPCIGCTEQGIGFHEPINKNLPIDRPTAPMAYPGVQPEHGVVGSSPVAVGLGSAVVGVLVGAGVMASKKMADADKAEGKE